MNMLLGPLSLVLLLSLCLLPLRNMIKSFFTASLLLDVLSVFGELSEEVR